jgi:hypothetical protein
VRRMAPSGATARKRPRHVASRPWPGGGARAGSCAGRVRQTAPSMLRRARRCPAPVSGVGSHRAPLRDPSVAGRGQAATRLQAAQRGHATRRAAGTRRGECCPPPPPPAAAGTIPAGDGVPPGGVAGSGRGAELRAGGASAQRRRHVCRRRSEGGPRGATSRRGGGRGSSLGSARRRGRWSWRQRRVARRSREMATAMTGLWTWTTACRRCANAHRWPHAGI